MQCKTILMDRRVAITNPCNTSVDIKCFVEILVALGETKLIMRNGFRHKMWILISQCLASSVREGKINKSKAWGGEKQAAPHLCPSEPHLRETLG